MGNFLTVQTLIMVLVTFLVTAGIKSISSMLGLDLSGYGSAVTAALVAILFGVFQSSVIPLIPAEFLPLVDQIAGLLIALLGAMGVHKTVKSFQV